LAVTGRTTLAQARDFGVAGDDRIVSEGHLAMGGGSLTIKGERKLRLEEVLRAVALCVAVRQG
jgi:hypothetical protein